MRNQKILFSLSVLIIFFLFCSKTEKFDVQTTIEEGVKIISNPSSPRDGIVEYVLEEDLSIGIEDGDENYMFFRASDIDVDGEGNIYVLDSGNNRIQVYDRDGNHIHTIGKKGQGPGEMENAFRMSLAQNGAIGIVDSGNMRVTLFHPDGSYATDFKMEQGFASDLGFCIGNQIIIMQNTGAEKGEQNNEFKLYDDKGNFVSKIAEFPGRQIKIMMRGKMAISIPMPFSSATAWTVGKNGTIFFGNSSQYEINVYAPDGTLKHKIRRAGQLLEVTAQEQDETLNSLKTRGMPEDLMKEITFPKYKPYFETNRGFLIDDAGNLMVRLPQAKKAEKTVTYDVFDSNGIYIHQAKI